MMEGFVWARVPGDIVFSFGVFFLALFAFKLLGGRKAEVVVGSVRQPA